MATGWGNEVWGPSQWGGSAAIVISASPATLSTSARAPFPVVPRVVVASPATVAASARVPTPVRAPTVVTGSPGVLVASSQIGLRAGGVAVLASPAVLALTAHGAVATALATGGGAVWTIDLRNLSGGLVQAGLKVDSLRAVWSLAGPGAIEFGVREGLAANCLAGQRRVVLRRAGAIEWQGVLESLQENDDSWDDLAATHGALLSASGLGLASVFEPRVVHGDFSRVLTVATTIAWALINHAQGQIDGDWGITQGTIVGTAPARTRDFCDGDNIVAAINELAEKDTGGFDWEIDENGAFNAWVGGRGVVSGETATRAGALSWAVRNGVGEMATYVTALGDSDEPCGAPLVTVSSPLRTTYKRREYTVDVDSIQTPELTDSANDELKSRARSRLRVSATYRDAPDSPAMLPWGWRDVWLGDTLTVELPAHYGGNQTLKTIEVAVYVEPPDFAYVEYEWEAV